YHNFYLQARDLFPLMEGSPSTDATQWAMVAGKEGHPIFAGLTQPIKIQGQYARSNTTHPSAAAADTLAKDANGNNLVLTRIVGQGKVVNFALYLSGDTEYPGLINQPTQQLIYNAITW